MQVVGGDFSGRIGVTIDLEGRKFSGEMPGQDYPEFLQAIQELLDYTAATPERLRVQMFDSIKELAVDAPYIPPHRSIPVLIPMSKVVMSELDDPIDQYRTFRALVRACKNPEAGDVMRPDSTGLGFVCRKVRAGNIRILYDIRDGGIELICILRREDAYKDSLKRRIRKIGKAVRQ